MNILFYGTASYDRDSFTRELKDNPEIKIDFTETNLTPMTEALAKHSMALALAAIRRIWKGYIRVRENDFSLDGLVGESLRGKTAGIIGAGRIDVYDEEGPNVYQNRAGQVIESITARLWLSPP